MLIISRQNTLSRAYYLYGRRPVVRVQRETTAEESGETSTVAGYIGVKEDVGRADGALLVSGRRVPLDELGDINIWTLNTIRNV